MKITKFGHCCLLLEVKDVRILFDPGNYNETPDVKNIDTILITHEHQDHLHLPALKEILARNPLAQVISHAGVTQVLKEAHVPATLLKDGEVMKINEIRIESSGHEHACIHPDLPKIQNTGFFIDESFFYPGDSFHDPKKEVKVLALPVAGPWMKIDEAVEYAKTLKPKVVCPVHDGMLRQEHQLSPTRRIPQSLLSPLGIEYVDMREGSVQNFSSFLDEAEEKVAL